MDQIRLKAYGKINLGLDVLGRREDGYHEVRMIMQSVRIYDDLTLKKSREPGIRVTTNRSFLPTGEGNLVYKAAKILIDVCGIKEGILIDLKKFLPVAAGMAGGSSDAAAVLCGMNQLFSLGLTQEKLMEYGLRVGADVPFCIMRGTVLAEGIGEVLKPLPAPPPCHVLLAKPAVSVSTKTVYEQIDQRTITAHPDIDGMISAISAQDLKGLAGTLGNVLELVTGELYPQIGEIERFMKEKGALGAIMSGSGPTVFGLFEDDADAQKAYTSLKEERLAKQVYLTTFFEKRQAKGSNR